MNILIVKLGAIGDVVMASSMLEASRSIDKNASITWLCGKGVEPLVRSFVGVDRVITIDENRLVSGGSWERIIELIETWRQLFLKRFDLVVIGHTDYRYYLLTVFVLAKNKRCLRGRRLVRGRWHASEYARLIYDVDGPDIPTVKLSRINAETDNGTINSLPKGQRVLMFPGGARNMLRDDALRRWPIEYYRILAEKIIQRGVSVVIAGGNDDIWIRDSFKNVDVIDMIGMCSLPQVIALCAACELVVTHDSGPLHLSIAAGTDTLALFGPTNPMEKVPSDSKVKVLWGGEQLRCRPCYDGRSYSICSSNLCLKDLTVEKVYQEVTRILHK